MFVFEPLSRPTLTHGTPRLTRQRQPQRQPTNPSPLSTPTTINHSKMVVNDTSVASLITLISSLFITKPPSSCDADAYLTEPEILRAYQGSSPSTLRIPQSLLTCFLELVDDLEGFLEAAASSPRRAERQLAVTFEHAFSAVCCALSRSGVVY